MQYFNQNPVPCKYITEKLKLPHTYALLVQSQILFLQSIKVFPPRTYTNSSVSKVILDQSFTNSEVVRYSYLKSDTVQFGTKCHLLPRLPGEEGSTCLKCYTYLPNWTGSSKSTSKLTLNVIKTSNFIYGKLCPIGASCKARLHWTDINHNQFCPNTIWYNFWYQTTIHKFCYWIRDYL